ncbi:DUF3347 domain-containing protein [Pontibacter arcticus]|uniref:DUF3347 domain-containing protein n=1 Tax=Pontibacter arcticus TaxID=2080288 RepID=A0A364RBX6_9BACT|nr:DUF3347 domain-containing protein [Pontibacter arcticus]RAU81793.1 DUF3347 domain-containing protein [Pontibacter arcticus]
MKKTLIAATFCAFIFTACSEQKPATEGQETAQAEQASEDSEAETVVVETPDFTATGGPVKMQVEQLLTDYITLKDALIESDAATAKTAATTVLTAVNAIPVASLAGDEKQYTEEKTQAIKDAATAISGSADLGVQRTHLQPLSEATYALTKAFGATDQKLYYQYCPMAFDDKGAYWISTEEQVLNPYFGDAMLKCGTNKEAYN